MDARATAATAADLDRLIPPMVLAFARDPVVRWLLPDPSGFLEHFPAIVRVHAARVVEHGGAFQASGFRAAALWYPPGVHPDAAALGEVLERAVAPRALQAMSSLIARMREHAPEGPHWYLRQVGVDPAAQGTGLGAELLRAGLAACDGARLPAYLEATSPANRAVYERFGFRPTGEIQVEGAPPLWPMLRPTRT